MSSRAKLQRRLHLTFAIVSAILLSVMSLLIANDSSQTKNHRALEETLGPGSISEGEELEDPTAVDFTCIVAIALMLIALTILFEKAKEHLEESVSHEMELILEKLFGELTILGFLATIVFIVHQSGTLAVASERIGLEEEELAEYVEYVHYTIFFIMVGFVVQVLALVNEAAETEEVWSEYDEDCRLQVQSNEDSSTPEEENFMSTEDELHLSRNPASFCKRLIPTFPDALDHLREKVVFQALRREFIVERSPHEPFHPVEESKRVEKDFLFGRYLGLAQIHLLTHVVEVRVPTWAVFAFGTISFYIYALCVRENLLILAWSWVAVGWLALLFNVIFEQHLLGLRNMFLPQKLLELLHGSEIASSAHTTSEHTPLSTDVTHDRFGLPAWCYVSVSGFKRSWWANLFVKGVPNRQQCFFWFDRHGPVYYLQLLQLNLIYTGVYAGLLILTFLPAVWSIHSVKTFIVYLILAVIPGIGMTYNKKRLVSVLTQVCSIGSYRKPQIIADVRREAKTTNTVRTFLVFQKMRMHLEGNLSSHETNIRRISRLSQSLSSIEQAEVTETFSSLDADGSGSISDAELVEFLTRMGMHTDGDSIRRLVSNLDADGDGEITRDEFLLWYVDMMRENMTMHDRAKELFGIFDANANGEITIGDFKSKFDALNLGFSVDEIGSIVNELDRDRSGSVSLHEFEFFLEKYYPRELLRRTLQDSHETHGEALDHNGRQLRHGSNHRH